MHLWQLIHRKPLLTGDNIRKCTTIQQLKKWPEEQMRLFIDSMFETKNHSLIHHFLRYFPDHPDFIDAWRANDCTYNYMLNKHQVNILNNLPQIPQFVLEDFFKEASHRLKGPKWSLTELKVVSNIANIMVSYKEQCLNASMIPSIPYAFYHSILCENPDFINDLSRHVPLTPEIIAMYHDGLIAHDMFDEHFDRLLDSANLFLGFNIKQPTYALEDTTPVKDALLNFLNHMSIKIRPWDHVSTNKNIQAMLDMMCQWLHSQENKDELFGIVVEKLFREHPVTFTKVNGRLQCQYGPYVFGDANCVQSLLLNYTATEYKEQILKDPKICAWIQEELPMFYMVRESDCTLFPDIQIGSMVSGTVVQQEDSLFL